MSRMMVTFIDSLISAIRGKLSCSDCVQFITPSTPKQAPQQDREWERLRRKSPMWGLFWDAPWVSPHFSPDVGSFSGSVNLPEKWFWIHDLLVCSSEVPRAWYLNIEENRRRKRTCPIRRVWPWKGFLLELTTRLPVGIASNCGENISLNVVSDPHNFICIFLSFSHNFICIFLSLCPIRRLVIRKGSELRRRIDKINQGVTTKHNTDRAYSFQTHPTRQFGHCLLISKNSGTTVYRVYNDILFWTIQC
jgi:hypothetical protein